MYFINEKRILNQDTIKNEFEELLKFLKYKTLYIYGEGFPSQFTTFIVGVPGSLTHAPFKAFFAAST